MLRICWQIWNGNAPQQLEDSQIYCTQAQHTIDFSKYKPVAVAPPESMQINPIWPRERVTADGLPLRELHEVIGAALENFGNDILPSVEKISAVHWLAMQLTGATQARVGKRWRSPCQLPHNCRQRCLGFPSILCPISLFKPCTQHSRLYLLHICIYMSASILTAFQAAHSLLRLHEAEDKVRDVIPSWNWRIIVGNAAVIANTVSTKVRYW